MQYTYSVRKDLIKDEDGVEYTVFGIDAFDSVGNLTDSVSDIFFEKAEAENLAQLCNECDLDIVHLHEIIEDILD